MSPKYDWRCLCGAENEGRDVDCAECGKQRWSQLGFSRIEARGLRDAVIPLYLARRGVQSA